MFDSLEGFLCQGGSIHLSKMYCHSSGDENRGAVAAGKLSRSDPVGRG